MFPFQLLHVLAKVFQQPLEPLECVWLLAPANMTMMALGMMVIVKHSRLLLAGSNENESIPDALRILPTHRHLPCNSLLKTTSIYLQSLDETTRSVAETLTTPRKAPKKAVDNGQDFGQDFSRKPAKNRVRPRRITRPNNAQNQQLADFSRNLQNRYNS